jgi:hypothetical protein
MIFQICFYFKEVGIARVPTSAAAAQGAGRSAGRGKFNFLSIFK